LRAACGRAHRPPQLRIVSTGRDAWMRASPCDPERPMIPFGVS
jgi:hypothetical protein